MPGSPGLPAPFGDDSNPNWYYKLYVKGTVTDIYGDPIEDVYIGVRTNTGFYKSDYTDDYGFYSISFYEQNFVFNSFTIVAIKDGYDYAVMDGYSNDYINWRIDITLYTASGGIGFFP